ncbi:MAG: 30S ribosomal protein S9 [Candidatus Micrarchaeaceae archaeon]|jgi:small subunit ribosomal protein S9|nr:30S ribosomal protein S9 [Candidatus Micrarchaeota archaeon]
MPEEKAEDNQIKAEVAVQAVKPEAAVQAPVKKRAAPRKKSASKKETKVVFVKSKRKSAIARASAKPGTGRIHVNGFDINVCEPLELRRIMAEPIGVSSITRDIARGLDININVHGGGISSQAQAVRNVIAKSIEKSSGSDTVRKEYMRHDRFMLIDDARRVEPKKFKGPKARARFQKSYR